MWTSLLSAPVRWSNLASVAGHFRFIKFLKKIFNSVMRAGLGNGREGEVGARGPYACAGSVPSTGGQFLWHEQKQGQGGDLQAGCMHTWVHLPAHVCLPCPRMHAPGTHADSEIFMSLLMLMLPFKCYYSMYYAYLSHCPRAFERPRLRWGLGHLCGFFLLPFF